MSRIQVRQEDVLHRSINTDDVMWNSLIFLHHDLFQHTGINAPMDIKEARDRSYEIPKYASPYVVKCKVQLACWLKRYRFEDDVLTNQELDDVTNVKFLEHQHRIGKTKPMKLRTFLVLQEARKTLKNVLGDFREEDILPYCRFSRNSTVGFRGEEVYLHDKIFPGSRLTGTQAEVKWFHNYLESDPLLKSCLTGKDGEVHFDVVTSLKQVNVPKTAKILRPVRPNTLIGSFRSYGIGELVRTRLKERLGIDLNRLQEKHQVLACKASRTMSLATADLSSASDNFTSDLLNRLLPRSWFRALSLGRTRYVTLGGSVIPLNSPSFMAMGVGYTFTVMTACFQAILLAIMKLLGRKGHVSVFGDDLIYPTHIHPFVVEILDDINFPINHDKTFTDLPFRESCGGDYYDQIDVRPASPKGMQVVLGGLAIAAYVYKLFNSLVRRWEAEELPNTLSYLKSILRQLGLPIFSVPPHFPDESGLKDGEWRKSATAEAAPTNLRTPFYMRSLIPCLVQSHRYKPAGYQGAYYWEKLQKGFRDEDLEVFKYLETNGASDVLVWRKVKATKQSNVGDAKENVRYRKLVAFVAKRRSTYHSLSSTLV